LDGTLDDSWSPALAASNGKVYAVWYDERHNPDTIGVYFSHWQAQPDAVVGKDGTRPDDVKLSAYPNPFNSSTTLTLTSWKGGEGTIEIFDAAGRLLTTISFQGGKDGAKMIWDATDNLGRKVSSGPYFARARANDKENTIKLLYIK
jgi:flagellar hook assembly protein FlgD